MEIRFLLEDGAPCLTLTHQAVESLLVLKREAARGFTSLECTEPTLSRATLTQLCDAVDRNFSVDALRQTSSANALGEMLALDQWFSLADELKHRLCDALLCALQTYTEDSLMALCDTDAVDETEHWFYTETQLRLQDQAFRRRLHVTFCALCALLGGNRLLAAECLARVPLPTTALERLCQELGVSCYFARALYEFGLARPPQKILYLVCTNRQVETVNAALHMGTERERLGPTKLLKALLDAHHAPLKRQCSRGQMTLAERDAAMVRRFVGWAMTESGYVVYLYYRGPSSRSPQDFAQLHNWALVPVDLLRYFHARLGKDCAKFQRVASTDLTESADGARNATLDVRYLVHRWVKLPGNAAALERLTGSTELFHWQNASLLEQLGAC